MGEQVGDHVSEHLSEHVSEHERARGRARGQEWAKLHNEMFRLWEMMLSMTSEGHT